MKKQKTIWILQLLMLLVAFGFVFSQIRSEVMIANAIDLDDEEEVEEAEEELESLEQKAKKYQKMINLKQQEKASLQNQMQLMDIQISSYDNDVSIVEEDIEENKNQIKELERQVDQKEESLKLTKEELSELIRVFHRIDEEIAMEYLSAGGDMTKIFNQSEFLEQASHKMKGVIEEVEKEKDSLKKEQEELKEKNDELGEREEALQEKRYYLNTEKNAKKVVLQKTQGEEAKYQELLSRVEQQKKELLGDLGLLSGETQARISSILKKAKKPKDGLASTKWYYAQDDKDWAYKRIGLSSSLMKDYGCAVTSLSMVFTFHDEDITPGKMASQPMFYRDLIVWPTHWKGLDLDSSIYHGNINWSEVKKSIKKDQPVIVFVRARSGAGHYVVVHGRDDDGEYVVHDPLFGPNIYLDTTKDLVEAIYGTSVSVDQMIIYED